KRPFSPREAKIHPFCPSPLTSRRIAGWNSTLPSGGGACIDTEQEKTGATGLDPVLLSPSKCGHRITRRVGRDSRLPLSCPRTEETLPLRATRASHRSSGQPESRARWRRVG